jgi:hypothetical protein
MPPPSSLTLQYDALLSSTLFNAQTEWEDNISTSNAFFYILFRHEEDGYEGEANLGERVQIQLMYQLGSPDSHSGYDTMVSAPMDGATSAFWDWRQFNTSVQISRIEERKNSGEFAIVKLLKGKVKQAQLGSYEFFSKAFLQGQGMNDPATAGQIETPRVSPSNGSLFIDPLPLLVKKDPTTSTLVGNINQSTSTWWRNQTADFTGLATFTAQLKRLRKLNNDCSKGPGGMPNVHLVDQNVYEWYETALAAQNRYIGTKRADIPFDNIDFRGHPVVWDEFVPNASDRVVALVTTKGTWYMLNTKFWKIKYDEETNFMNTPFERPTNQDAKTSHILWYGASCVSNRRKNGVGWSIDTTVVAA